VKTKLHPFQQPFLVPILCRVSLSQLENKALKIRTKLPLLNPNRPPRLYRYFKADAGRFCCTGQERRLSRAGSNVFPSTTNELHSQSL